MGEFAHRSCKKHNSLSKKYKSSQKVNGKIPFKCKKYIQLNKDVSRSSNRTSSKEIDSELSHTVPVTSNKIDSKKIDSELSHTVPVTSNKIDSKEIDSELSHTVPATSTSIPRTEVQFKQCSVVLHRIYCFGESKYKETILDKKVPQFKSANNASVFEHRTLNSRSSTKKKSIETACLVEQHLDIPKRRTSTRLNTRSRRNSVLPQPETSIIQETNYDRKYISVTKPSVLKPTSSRTDTISSRKLNKVQCSTENIPIDDICLISTSSELSVQSNNKEKTRKQILKHHRKSSASFQNTDRLSNRRNQSCTLNIPIDDICLSRNSPESYVVQSNNKMKIDTSLKQISKDYRKSRRSNRINQFNSCTVNIPIDDICLSRNSPESHVVQSNKMKKDTSVKQISKDHRRSCRRNQFNSCTVNIPIDDICLSRRSLPSGIVQSDTISQNQKPTCRKTREKRSEQKNKNKRSATHEVEIPSVQITKSGKSRPNHAQSLKRASSKSGGKISSLNRKAKKVKSKNVPINDLTRSRRPQNPKSKDFTFLKKKLKRKRNAISALQKADEQYEDDIYESKKFDKFKELFVDTSDESSDELTSGMSTPELEFIIPPSICEQPCKFVDCISLADLKLQRKIAEDCMFHAKMGIKVDLTNVSVCSF